MKSDFKSAFIELWICSMNSSMIYAFVSKKTFHSRVKLKFSSSIFSLKSRSSLIKSWTFSFWDLSILLNKLHRRSCLSSITLSMTKSVHMMLYVTMSLVCVIHHILFFTWFCVLIIHFESNCTRKWVLVRISFWFITEIISIIYRDDSIFAVMNLDTTKDSSWNNLMISCSWFFLRELVIKAQEIFFMIVKYYTFEVNIDNVK